VADKPKPVATVPEKVIKAPTGNMHPQPKPQAGPAAEVAKAGAPTVHAAAQPPAARPEGAVAAPPVEELNATGTEGKEVAHVPTRAEFYDLVAKKWGVFEELLSIFYESAGPGKYRFILCEIMFAREFYRKGSNFRDVHHLQCCDCDSSETLLKSINIFGAELTRKKSAPTAFSDEQKNTVEKLAYLLGQAQVVMATEEAIQAMAVAAERRLRKIGVRAIEGLSTENKIGEGALNSAKSKLLSVAKWRQRFGDDTTLVRAIKNKDFTDAFGRSCDTDFDSADFDSFVEACGSRVLVHFLNGENFLTKNTIPTDSGSVLYGVILQVFVRAFPSLHISRKRRVVYNNSGAAPRHVIAAQNVVGELCMYQDQLLAKLWAIAEKDEAYKTAIAAAKAEEENAYKEMIALIDLRKK
jgi:hypothetical protein